MKCPYCNAEMVEGYMPYKGFAQYWCSKSKTPKMMIKVSEPYVPVANKKIVADVFLCKGCDVIIKKLNEKSE